MSTKKKNMFSFQVSKLGDCRKISKKGRAPVLEPLRAFLLLTCFFMVACGSASIKTSLGVKPSSNEPAAQSGASSSPPGASTGSGQGTGTENKLAHEVREILKANCLSCHGDKQTSQGGLTAIDQLETLIATGLVVAGQPEESKLLRRMKTNMPPPPAPLLDKPKLDTIERWIKEGAKLTDATTGSLRKPLQLDSDIVAAISADFQKLGANERAQVRYFTLWPLWNMNVSDDIIKDSAQGLAKFLNSVSASAKLVTPFAINPDKSIFRIFLSDFGWSSAVWKVATEKESLFRNHPKLATLRTLIGDAVPLVRADEFIAMNSLAPNYYHLQGLKLSLTDFLTQDLKRTSLAGIYAEVRSGTAEMRRLGFNSSQVADFSRVIERHTSSSGVPFWLSHEFGTANEEQDPFRKPFGPTQFAATGVNEAGAPAEDPSSKSVEEGALLNIKNVRPTSSSAGNTTASGLAFRADGHEIIFTKPNGMLGFYVATASGQRLDTAPTGVRDSTSTEASIGVGSGCMSCHYDGVIEKTDEISRTFDVSVLSSTLRNLFTKIFAQDSASLFLADRALYQNALSSIGVESNRRDPVHRVRTSFNRSATRDEVAAIFETTDANLNAVIEKLPAAAKAAYAPFLVSGGQLPRSTFSTHLAEALNQTRGSDPSETGLPDQLSPTPSSPPVAAELQAFCAQLRRQMEEKKVIEQAPICAKVPRLR